MTKLSLSDIENSLTQLNANLLDKWVIKDGKLYKEFIFTNFKKAFRYMSKVAIIAEEMNHHPEWFNCYRKLIISLTTHDVDGISILDFEFANKIEKLV